MERKTWVKPMTLVQKFEANETVAAQQCYGIRCNINAANDLEGDKWPQNPSFGWGQVWHTDEGCGAENSHVLIDTNGDKIADIMREESGKGNYACNLFTNADYNQPAAGVPLEAGTTVYWTTIVSEQQWGWGVWGDRTYHHQGTVTQTVPGHPNRS